MTETPRKGVKWDSNISLSLLDSPLIDGSMLSVVATSSIEYINSQLVAHGFASYPGLVLDGISDSNLECVARCLLSMLGQRVEDISRTEDLTTKLRTLTYDNERLRSLHRDVAEVAANAEREMNVHKSRLLTVTRSLQTSEAAQKQTSAELQRTRTLLQGVRATHVVEIKKKEKDIERMAEKWSKIADAQAKLMAVPSGMRCANVFAVPGSDTIGKSKNYLEIALEETEKARSRLIEETLVLRRPASLEHSEEPTPYTLTTLFPLHPAGNAHDKISVVLNYLRETVTITSHRAIATAQPAGLSTIPISDSEVERLQGVINTLREELEQSRQHATKRAAETQAMFDKFAEDHRVTADIGEMSIELMSAPLCDYERERLDVIKRELDEERQRFTEAAIKLGKERAELEAERNKLIDEKRSWQVEIMLAELPPTPQPVASPRKATIQHSPKKSPRKSPAKVCVGKAGTGHGRKATRVSRRSSLASPSKVLPAFETEFLPPLSAPSFNPKPLPTSLLPTSFVLPPPSPHTSLPTEPALPSGPALDVTYETPLQSVIPIPPEPADSAIPATPARRLFPVAKPLAQRMIHAYSPAKPSPLSRILQLGDSPNSPGAVSFGLEDISSLLQPVLEEDERAPDSGSPLEALSQPTAATQMSLAAELGVSESPPESPLQEKKLEPNGGVRPPVANGRVFHLDPKRLTAQEKGKAKAQPATIGRMRTSASVEKENVVKLEKRIFTAPPRISPPTTSDGMKKTKLPLTTKAKPIAKIPPAAVSGPRRVLITSEEAPPVGKGWRG